MITENFKKLLKFVDDYGEKYNISYTHVEEECYDNIFVSSYYFYRNNIYVESWRGDSYSINYFYIMLRKWKLLICKLKKVD